MKLSASYNLWDCEYLLEGSIKQIRDHVDHVSVVYQQYSNFSEPSKINLLEYLTDLKDRKLIDSIMLYKPIIMLPPSSNETLKRNIGIQLAKKNECAHHISIDAEESYITEEFKKAKEYIIANDIKHTACSLFTYWKSTEYVLKHK